jgi:peptide/nickel transport system substrate-binding protein
VNALKTQVMRGLSIPTGIPLPSPKGAGVPDSLEKRYPTIRRRPGSSSPRRAYPNGFSFTMHCPNDRYVNDEKICIALAGMWAKVRRQRAGRGHAKTPVLPEGAEARLLGVPAGLGRRQPGRAHDAQVRDAFARRQGSGDGNYGDFRNAELDKYIDIVETEMDMAKRQEAHQASRSRSCRKRCW